MTAKEKIHTHVIANLAEKKGLTLRGFSVEEVMTTKDFHDSRIPSFFSRHCEPAQQAWQSPEIIVLLLLTAILQLLSILFKKQ